MKGFGASGGHGARAVQHVAKGRDPEEEGATKMESFYLPMTLLFVLANL